MEPWRTITSRMKLISILLSIAAACAADIRNVTSTADAIVVATTDSRLESPTNVSFDLLIKRTLKGAPLPDTIHVSHSWGRRGIIVNDPLVPVAWQASGIWFLKQAGGDWDILPAAGQDGIFVNLFFPASTDQRRYHYPEPTPLNDKVVYELADGLWAKGADPNFVSSALAYKQSPAATQVLSDFLESGNAALQSSALAGILAISQPGAPQKLLQMWSSLDESYRWWSLRMLKESYRDTSPASVAQLIAIAKNEALPFNLRDAALQALAAIHTKETIPFFASLLTRPEGQYQMRAVVAISAFANGCPPETPENRASMEYMQFINPSQFRNRSTIDHFAVGWLDDSAKRAELTQFWTAWWAQNRSAF